jgi:hypothetical protein
VWIGESKRRPQVRRTFAMQRTDSTLRRDAIGVNGAARARLAAKRRSSTPGRGRSAWAASFWPRPRARLAGVGSKAKAAVRYGPRRRKIAGKVAGTYPKRS